MRARPVCQGRGAVPVVPEGVAADGVPPALVQHFRDEPDAAVDRGTPAQTFARTLRVCVYSADTADGIDLETVDRESSCPAIEYHSATEHLRTAWGNPSLACDLRLLGQEEV